MLPQIRAAQTELHDPRRQQHVVAQLGNRDRLARADSPSDRSACGEGAFAGAPKPVVIEIRQGGSPRQLASAAIISPTPVAQSIVSIQWHLLVRR
jgi:hypothetical protein